MYMIILISFDVILIQYRISIETEFTLNNLVQPTELFNQLRTKFDQDSYVAFNVAFNSHFEKFFDNFDLIKLRRMNQA